MTVPFLNQNQVAPGDPDACGTTSLAMVLQAYGKIPETLAAAQALDKSLRAPNLFTPPGVLAASAKSHGLPAVESFECSLVDLQNALKVASTETAFVPTF